MKNHNNSKMIDMESDSRVLKATNAAMDCTSWCWHLCKHRRRILFIRPRVYVCIVWSIIMHSNQSVQDRLISLLFWNSNSRYDSNPSHVFHILPFQIKLFHYLLTFPKTKTGCHYIFNKWLCSHLVENQQKVEIVFTRKMHKYKHNFNVLYESTFLWNMLICLSALLFIVIRSYANSSIDLSCG